MSFEPLSHYLSSLNVQYGIPAADCKITRNHKVVFRQMTGYCDYEGRMMVADEFRMGFPIQWPVREEKCHLAHNTIRIIDLMTMTAGLSYVTMAKELDKCLPDSL